MVTLSPLSEIIKSLSEIIITCKAKISRLFHFVFIGYALSVRLVPEFRCNTN